MGASDGTAELVGVTLGLLVGVVDGSILFVGVKLGFSLGVTEGLKDGNDDG